ncbi:Nn.00g005770.m01.CDS01 [Neocucurbitaria sp. VM-36]
MKSSTIFAILSTLCTSSVLAQTACDAAASAIPTCGVPCISSAASAAGCTTGDYACRCSNSGPIQTSAQACVIGNCGIATALQVQASASAVCACVATATAA